MRIYLSSQYRNGMSINDEDVIEVNLRRHFEAAVKLAERGHIVFTPLTYHFWHIVSAHSEDFWMRQMDSWMELCDCIVRLDGESKGADRECELAKKLLIPVYKYERFMEEKWE